MPGGPRYIWLMPIVVGGMLFVALVFGELGSHYPVAGALYQYSKYTVGPGYGWWVGWFYGIALLVTVAAVDTGVVPYVASLSNNWFDTSLDPTNHTTILLVTLALLAVQTTLNIIGAKMMGRVAGVGTYVEIIGTFGIAIILAIAGLPPRVRLPVLDAGRGARQDEPARRRLRRQLVDRCRARRDPRARLHLLRLRVRG